MYRKNVAGQNLAFGLVSATTGAAVTGATVSAFRSIDGGAQASATGSVSEKANGQYNLALSQADTNGNHIGVLLTATGAVPVHFSIVTTADDPTTASPSAADIATAVWAYTVETGWSAVQSARVMLAALAGKVSGANSTTVTIRDTGDSKDRIVAAVDQFGNRTSITYDKT